MRLTRLQLQSFRSSIGLDLSLDAPRILIAGLNGSGKSSVRDAIRWTLTGLADELDGKGAGAEVLIPHFNGHRFASEIEVGLDVLGLGTITRRYSERGGHTLGVHGFTGSLVGQQQALYQLLHTTPAHLTAVLTTWPFLELGHAEAKALILALLDVRIAVPSREQPYTLTELDAAYQAAYEERRQKKADLKRRSQPIAPATKDVPPIAEIERRLRDLRSELEALLTASGALLVRRQEQLRILARVKADWDEAAQVQGRLVAAYPQIDADIQASEERLAELVSGQDEAVKAPAEGTAERLTWLHDRAAALRGHRPKSGCVLDESVPCQTAIVKFQSQAATYEAEWKSLETAVPLSGPSLNEQRIACERHLADLREVAGRIQTLTERLETLKHAEQDVQAQLSQLEDTTATETAIAALRARIEKGQGVLREAETLKRAQEAFSTAQASYAAAEAEILALEQAVAELGPTGARVAALQQAIGPFEAAVNETLCAWGWTVRFILEPWSVEVNGRILQGYSKSERFRIGIAIQLAVARLSGLNFAVVDELDILDTGTRHAMSELLMSAPIEQVIVLATREPSVPLPLPGAVLSYRLAQVSGRTVVTEGPGAN